MGQQEPARVGELRAEIARLKATIRRDRRTLATRAAELSRECAVRGIRLVLTEQKGEGEDPWPTESRSSVSTP